MEKNSSIPLRRGTLAPKLDRFLDEFANSSAFDRLGRSLGGLLPPNLESPYWASRLFELQPEETRNHALREYQELIREVWKAATDGERRYFTFMLRSRLYEALIAEARDSVPKTLKRSGEGKFERVAPWRTEYSAIIRSLPATSFDDVIDRLAALAGRTKVCGNSACETPYFIAARKSQRYCNEKCANVFQQRAKREWWRQHGKKWRQQQNSLVTKPVEENADGKARK
jgi:hypothetical protein